MPVWHGHLQSMHLHSDSLIPEIWPSPSYLHSAHVWLAEQARKSKGVQRLASVQPEMKYKLVFSVRRPFVYISLKSPIGTHWIPIKNARINKVT